MSDEVGMEMPELADLGRRVTAIGERFARDVAEIRSWSHSATGLVGGSHLCIESIGDVAEQWRGTLGLLADSIENFGSSLTRSATEFRVVDGDAAEVIKQAGDEQVIRQPSDGQVTKQPGDGQTTKQASGGQVTKQPADGQVTKKLEQPR